MNSQINLEVRDSLFNPLFPKGDSYQYFQSEKTQFRVWIYLYGPDTSFVDHVIYNLHPTFRQNERKVEQSYANPLCALEIFTWGIFTVKAKIFDKRGKNYVIEHMLSYDQELKHGGIKGVQISI